MKDYKDTSWKENKVIVSDILSIVKPKIIVDIGTFKGYSANAFACYSDADVYTIDPVKQYISLKENVTFINKTSEEAFKDWKWDNVEGKDDKGFIDILHIDGDHSYKSVRFDIVNWTKHMTKDGIVLIHDVLNIGIAGFGPIRTFLQAIVPYKAVYPKGQGLGMLIHDRNILDKLFENYDLWTAEYIATVWTCQLAEMLENKFREEGLV